MMRTEGESTYPKIHLPQFLIDYPPDKIPPVIQQLFLHLQQSSATSPSSPNLSATVLPRSSTPPPPTKKKNKKKIKPLIIPVKRIVTPDWIDAAPSRTLIPAPSDGVFDLIAMHQKIELFESRIQSGQDPHYKHPAMAREAANSDPIPIRNPEDIAKYERYTELSLPVVVPQFWPSRPWDKDFLRIDESDRLKAVIAELDKPPIFDRIDGVPHSPMKWKKPPSSAPKRVRPPPIVLLRLASCVTDDDDTDWGDF
jgi:hypothetical protein